MPLTKQYLRYESDGEFNIIASNNCNITFIKWKNQEGRYIACGASESVVVWDLRLSEKAFILPGEKSEATRLATNSNGQHLAVGYSDGSVKIFDLESNECVCTFSGHRSAITCLAFNSDGQLLASGSKDTEVIVWDLVAEKGKLRLSGHKGVVTQVCFMNELPVVISSSKDTLVKFWDLDTGHCFKTLVGHKAEVWDLSLIRGDKFLVTGGSDSELLLWRLHPVAPSESEALLRDNTPSTTEIAGENDLDNFGTVKCMKAGSMLRIGRGRLQALAPDNLGHVLACHSTNNMVELFYFNSDEETQNKFSKRLKKWKKKGPENKEPEPTIAVTDEIKRLPVLKCSDKVKSCHLVAGKGGELRISTLLHSNKIELYSLMKDGKVYMCLRDLEKMGHRSDVRVVCFSSDGLAVATGSAEAVKVWNRPSRSCMRTLDTAYVYSLCFVPGDRHLLIGQDSKLLVADVGSAEILEEIPAHEKEIWSIVMQPDQRGCVTGSGDKTVKFWDFDLVASEDSTKSKAKVLSLLHTRTLQLEEGVLCVCISPNARHIAVSLLDSTVKIFFMDTLKFFVSLYGHKLPVLCMDICYDSTIICTGSADRNIKIWGMDFGDCHRSLFAHEDTVTSIKFVPKTHYFFSCGKDGRIKQWDADSFERIQTLQGHNGAAHSLAVSANHVVSCGVDRVVRIWTRTAEPLVLEDEREEERAKEEEVALATEAETVVAGQIKMSLPSRKTVGAEKAAELLLEAIDMTDNYRQLLTEYKQRKSKDTESKPVPPPMMVAFGIEDPDDFLVATIKRIRASDLEEALMLLPFSSVCQLLPPLCNILHRDTQGEFILHTISFLVHIHHQPIVASASLTPLIQELEKLSLKVVDNARDRVGTNLHALLMQQRQLEAQHNINIFKEKTLERKKQEQKRKRKELLKKHALVTI